MRSSDRKRLRFSGALSGLCVNQFLNADEHSPASSARSNCVHEQAAKLGPVSRAAGMGCECLFYWKGRFMRPEAAERSNIR